MQPGVMLPSNSTAFAGQDHQRAGGLFGQSVVVCEASLQYRSAVNFHAVVWIHSMTAGILDVSRGSSCRTYGGS